MDFISSIEWAAVAKIIGIDIMLGVDNAIVIALACASLPVHLRAKAIFYGTAGAILLRAILLFFASMLMGFMYIKLIAGAFLLYVGYKLLMENDNSHDVKSATHIWGAIKTILIADFMMSLDNVLAVSAAAQSAGEHSTIYAVLGILFSIPIIIFGSKGIMALMDKFPVIVWLGAGLLGWVGAEMMISDPVSIHALQYLHTITGGYTDIGVKIMGFCAVIFTVLAVKHMPRGEVRVK